MRFGDLTLDPDRRELWCGTRHIQLPRQRFRIMECLVRANGRTVRNGYLVNVMWNGRDDGPQDKSLHVCLFRLRRDLSALGAATIIETTKGVGYRLMNADEVFITLRLSPAEYARMAPQIEAIRRDEELV